MVVVMRLCVKWESDGFGRLQLGGDRSSPRRPMVPFGLTVTRSCPVSVPADLPSPPRVHPDLGVLSHVSIRVSDVGCTPTSQRTFLTKLTHDILFTSLVSATACTPPIHVALPPSPPPNFNRMSKARTVECLSSESRPRSGEDGTHECFESHAHFFFCGYPEWENESLSVCGYDQWILCVRRTDEGPVMGSCLMIVVEFWVERERAHGGGG